LQFVGGARQAAGSLQSESARDLASASTEVQKIKGHQRHVGTTIAQEITDERQRKPGRSRKSQPFIPDPVGSQAPLREMPTRVGGEGPFRAPCRAGHRRRGTKESRGA